jgi:hypothetical protein
MQPATARSAGRRRSALGERRGRRRHGCRSTRARTSLAAHTARGQLLDARAWSRTVVLSPSSAAPTRQRADPVALVVPLDGDSRLRGLRPRSDGTGGVAETPPSWPCDPGRSRQKEASVIGVRWFAALRLGLYRCARWPFRWAKRWSPVELWLIRRAVREQSRLFDWDRDDAMLRFQHQEHDDYYGPASSQKEAGE